MNQLRGNLAAKIVAVILLALSCLVLCGSLAGVLWLESVGAFRGVSPESMRNELIDRRLQDQAYPIMSELTEIPARELYGAWSVRFELMDGDWNRLAGDLPEDETVSRSWSLHLTEYYPGGLYFTRDDEPLTMAYEDYPEWTASPLPTPRTIPTDATAEETPAAEPEGTRVVWLRVSWTERSEQLGQGFDDELKAYELLAPWRYELIAAAAVSLLLAVLLFVFLMGAAGHHDASGEVKAGVVEKIPADLLWLIGVGGVCLFACVIGNFFTSTFLVSSLALTALCLLGAGLLALLCLMSTAVRLKLGTFLSGCLCWRFLRWCWKWIKAAFRAAGRLLHGLPLVWRWIPAFLALVFVDWILTAAFRRDTDMLLLIKLLQWALLAAAILYLVLAFRRLRQGAKAIAAGEEQVVIDEKYLLPEMCDHAEDLMHIRDGLSRAVDERMKSERLRTELITNVSHDIKTPLTSIINYVDLLGREELNNEKAAEYVEVLQRQSARLKKLTDDLVEASKAAAGSLPVEEERLDLAVLLDQTAGEYGERLAEKNLDLRVTRPDEPLYVRADPRHLWRMLDNLMSNILKYAQPGTRVYLNLEREGSRAALSFRNISAQPLNVKPEELTERFVRGDSARSTEGSGLGLAIAASLAKLQNIELDLSVDGDLFKVVLRFPTEA